MIQHSYSARVQRPRVADFRMLTAFLLSMMTVLDSGFRIPIVSGIPVCKAHDSGFLQQNFPDSGIRISLHRASKCFDDRLLC